MVYLTQQDLIDRFGERELIQLTDRTNTPATTIDATTVERHIADAESVIDSYVGKVYELPLSAVPPVLTKYAADLARYFLHGKAADKDSPVTMAYSQAIAWLKGVAGRTIQIEGANTILAPAGGGQVHVSAPTRIFTRDTLKGL